MSATVAPPSPSAPASGSGGLLFSPNVGRGSSSESGEVERRQAAEARGADDRRVLVVVNPVTRRDAAAMVDVVRRVAPSSVKLDIQLTSETVPIPDLVRGSLDGATTVLAIGGDGTVAQVAQALLGTNVPLGIIPAGSTNVIARELRIPMNPEAATTLCFGQHTYRQLDMGMCDDRAFLHIGGAGFDSMLFTRTNPQWKRRLGWLAYLPAAARSLRLRPSHFSLTIDGQQISVDSALVLVTNGGGLIKRALRLYPHIRHDDGKLDVLIFTATTQFQIIRTLLRLGRRDLVHSPFVLRIQGRDIRVAADPPMPVQVDGDVIGETPVTFTIIPHAIRMIAPAE